MPRTANSSSSPGVDERLVRIPLVQLHAHPRNSNVMPEEVLEKLRANIEREGRYPPVVVRPHSESAGDYQLLDGHQRVEALRRLGQVDALCFVWPCDDATALRLLATLNRLRGEDVPARRADLLAELSALVSVEELALLLPESAEAIRDLLVFRALDSGALLAQLEAAAASAATNAPRLVSFALLPEDEAVVEEAVALWVSLLTGANRRGRALGLICRAQLEAARA